MLKFSEFLIEVKIKKEKTEGGNNTLGVLHELLTGYHLNGGQHMEKHNDIDGDSPKQAHDKLAKMVTPEEYAEAHKRAKVAADDIRKRVGGRIVRVQWTSKPGDLKRSTDIEASQNEDPSDIVVTRHDGKHFGISLKKAEKTENAPIANPGMESTYGAQPILNAHRDDIKEVFPEIGKLSNAKLRKAFVRSNPTLQAAVREKGRRTLFDIASHMHEKLSNMSHEDLVHHLRTHVLHAHSTPMQAHGHFHMRHTTWGSNGNYQTKAIDPGTRYEHILNDPENISVEHAGQGVNFLYKGKLFAKHNIKFDSADDPMSSVKGATVEAGGKLNPIDNREVEAPKPVAAKPLPRAKKAPAPSKKRNLPKIASMPVQTRAVHPDEERASSEGMGAAITRAPKPKATRKPRPNIPIGNDGTHGGVVF